MSGNNGFASKNNNEKKGRKLRTASSPTVKKSNDHPSCQQKSCRDVWNSFLVSDANYSGPFEFPTIRPARYIPNRLISFSKAISCKDHDQWVHFFQHDWMFERIWRDPKRYLPILKQFNGVILPDFSVYRDMPLALQLWNIYRSRAIGHWFQANGIKVIVNIRYGDERTFLRSCDGVSKDCTIAIGTHGALKCSNDKKILAKGLAAVIENLKPCAIVIYGPAPDCIFKKYKDVGIKIAQFNSEISESHKAGK